MVYEPHVLKKILGLSPWCLKTGSFGTSRDWPPKPPAKSEPPGLGSGGVGKTPSSSGLQENVQSSLGMSLLHLPGAYYPTLQVRICLPPKQSPLTVPWRERVREAGSGCTSCWARPALSPGFFDDKYCISGIRLAQIIEKLIHPQKKIWPRMAVNESVWSQYGKSVKSTLRSQK
jgi:hypothetical protein